MWREMIGNLSADCKLVAPASHEKIAAAELALGARLPSGLKGLLLETDGVVAKHGVHLVWPVEEIQTSNVEFRSNEQFRELYMPFDALLFFGDAGNGDQFAFRILNGIVDEYDLFVWNHENDSRNWVAPSLGKYLEWWMSGKLKL